MRHSLKVLGLTLAAMFAMSALVAQGAQAVEHQFNSEVEKTVFTGKCDPTPGAICDHFKVGGGNLVCASYLYEGTGNANVLDEVTLTPTYGSTTKPSGCKDEGSNAEVLVHTNHCAYKLDSDTVLTAGTTEEHAPVEIECSGTEENEITSTIPSIGVTLHIPAQNTIKDGVTYTNIGSGSTREITAHVTAKNIKGKCTGVNCFLIGLVNGGEFTNAEYTGTDTFAGFEDLGTEQTGTAKTTPILNEGAQVGVFLTTP